MVQELAQRLSAGHIAGRLDFPLVAVDIDVSLSQYVRISACNTTQDNLGY